MPRGTQDPGRRETAFAYRAVTVSGLPFQCRSTSRSLAHSCVMLSHHPQLLLPPICNADRLFHRSGLGCSPFARHYSGNVLFSCGYKMFQFPACPPQHLCVQCWVPGSLQGGFPIRVSPALRLHTACRGFSQCTAPFFGSCRLGILQAPFFASP